MRKKLGRILSAELAMPVLTAALLPANPSLASPSENEVTKQVRSTYSKALGSFGKDSFDGYCGALINAQLYILSITTGVVHNNGNEEYDEYCDQDVTSGGYRITAYPARRAKAGMCAPSAFPPWAVPRWMGCCAISAPSVRTGWSGPRMAQW